MNHPNIITIYEIDETESGHFLATEFIDGVTLRERIRKASIKPGEVLDVAAQIASALSAAHAAGIVHRDVKPKHDRIVQLVDQMLEAKKQLASARTERDKTSYENKCATLDRQIDELVYKLYELTPEEIAIVEGAPSK